MFPLLLAKQASSSRRQLRLQTGRCFLHKESQGQNVSHPSVTPEITHCDWEAQGAGPLPHLRSGHLAASSSGFFVQGQHARPASNREADSVSLSSSEPPGLTQQRPQCGHHPGGEGGHGSNRENPFQWQGWKEELGGGEVGRDSSCSGEVRGGLPISVTIFPFPVITKLDQSGG